MKPPKKRRTTKALKNACIAAGLCVAAWGSSAPAEATTYEISGQITPKKALTDVYVVAGYNLNTSGMGVWVTKIDDANANTTEKFSFLVSNNPGESAPTTYTVVGLYSTTNVTLAMEPTAASIAIGPPSLSWDNVFPEYITEAQLADNLTDQLPGFYWEFINYGYWTLIGNNASLVNFSNATDGGTAIVNSTPVPLPPTLVLVLPGLGAILLLRRRQKSSEP